MKILAISGSPRSQKRSSTLKLVQAVAESTGCDYEVVSLSGKKIHGCIGCMQCVNDNICKLKDDFTPLRDKIVEADAYILGGCNFFSTLNASMHSFLERWYQFRHRENNTLWGKPAVTVAVAGGNTAPVSQILMQFCMMNFIKVVGQVDGLGANGCYYCGHGETCRVGAIHIKHGDGFKITEDNIPCVSKSPEFMDKASETGRHLGKLLHDGHDRNQATIEVKEAITALMMKGK